jgi:ubiquinone/menaquinone biosynthesis C-methylase UbiE
VTAKKKLPWASTEPALDRFRGDIADTYLSERVNKPVWRAETEAVKYFLGKMTDVNSVIDVPFGTGRFVELYLSKGLSVSGVDASPDMLRIARKELGDVYQLLDIRLGMCNKLPYEENSFDVAVCIRFLESIIPFHSVLPTLKEIHRVTRQYAIVRLNNRKSDKPPKQPPLPEERMGSSFYLWEVADYVEQAGWRLEDSLIVQVDNDGFGEKRICLLSAI